MRVVRSISCATSVLHMGAKIVCLACYLNYMKVSQRQNMYVCMPTIMTTLARNPIHIQSHARCWYTHKKHRWRSVNTIFNYDSCRLRPLNLHTMCHMLSFFFFIWVSLSLSTTFDLSSMAFIVQLRTTQVQQCSFWRKFGPFIDGRFYVGRSQLSLAMPLQFTFSQKTIDLVFWIVCTHIESDSKKGKVDESFRIQ